MSEIALLTLANHAEVQNGLLYLAGGEWDTVTRSYPAQGTPRAQHLSIAVTVVVPWTEANMPQAVSVRMEDEDGRHRVLETHINIEVGRPAGKPPGSDFRSPVAITGEVQFPHAGGYRVVAEVGESRRTYSFRVVDNVQEATPNG